MKETAGIDFRERNTVITECSPTTFGPFLA